MSISPLPLSFSVFSVLSNQSLKTSETAHVTEHAASEVQLVLSTQFFILSSVLLLWPAALVQPFTVDMYALPKTCPLCT